mgnify:CR=1 FL=1
MSEEKNNGFFKEQRKAAIKRKEAVYDRLIGSFQLDAKKMDIVIGLLILAIILIIVTQAN